jgi:hypothetical protein
MFSGPSRPAIVVSIVIALALSAACLVWQGRRPDEPRTLSTVTTYYSFPDRETGEPFGIAIRDGEMYFSDGAAGTIVKLGPDGKNSIFASGLNTPSGIAFLPTGDLVVADTGSHTIKKVNPAGVVSLLAGVENVAGSDDGAASTATFNGPIGVATTDNGEVYVSDTYNDRIRFIEQHGVVATVAGSSRGYADGDPSDARFDTPLGIALWQGKLLVADSGNRRIRVVDPQYGISTLAGTGEGVLQDGTLASAAFVSPAAVAVDDTGAIFIADGNAIRVVGRRAFPYVETLSGGGRGYADGASSQARFNRASGIAIDGSGFVLVADSDNRAIRALSGGQVGRQASADEIEERRVPAEQFRGLQPARWPYDPPGEAREIAGTLGEIRGEVGNARSRWFHNGLDIAGGYGEIARFIRTETVLDPQAAQNFGTARELIRLPNIGYIHLRLGRDRTDTPVSDNRFQFERDANGQLVNVRVPRGATFRAGDILGTLNSQNHVHLIAGPPGAEINALAALTLPGVSDVIPPVIENVVLLDQNWNEIKSGTGVRRISFGDKLRLVVEAYDRMDGNADRRRLGVYRLGYQVLSTGIPAADTDWTIVFDRMPPNEAASLVYAPGSRSGASGKTIFRYIVTNRISGDNFSEGFLDSAMLGPGTHLLRAYAADYFGNTTTKDIPIDVVR